MRIHFTSARLFRYISSVVNVRHPIGDEGLLLQPQCTWWMNGGEGCLRWNTMCLVRDCLLLVGARLILQFLVGGVATGAHILSDIHVLLCVWISFVRF